MLSFKDQIQDIEDFAAAQDTPELRQRMADASQTIDNVLVFAPKVERVIDPSYLQALEKDLAA